MEIFRLFGSIFVNTDAADESMKKTEKSAESIASKLGKGIATAAKWGAGIVTAATVATSAMVGLATDAAGTADEIDKMSQKIGFSTEAYQEWDYIAQKCGTSMETLQGGITDLAEKMHDAATGSGEAAEIFSRLGISVVDAEDNLRSQQEVFEETIIALQQMENATERQALATKLMSTTGEELLPLLNGQVESIDTLKQSAHDLGLVMSEDAVSAGVTLGDTIDDIKQSFTMIGTSLGSEVIPVIRQFADIIISNMPMIQQTIGTLAPVLVSLVSTLLPPLTELIQMLLPVLIDLFNQLMPPLMQVVEMIMPVIAELLSMLIPPLMEIVQTLLPPLMQIIEALMPLLNVLMELLMPILQLVLDLIAPLVRLTMAVLTPLIEILAQLLTDALAPLIPLIEVISQLFEGQLMVTLEHVTAMVESVVQVFRGLIDFIVGVFTGDWEQAWNGVIDIFSGLFSGLVNIVKYPLNQIITGINSVFSALGEIQIPDWVPVIGGSTFSLPKIPMLYKGGNVIEEGTVMVGEKGPELLNLPRGARVTPLDGNEVQTLDYSMLMKVIVEAIRMVIPELEQVIQIIPDEDGIYKIVRKKNNENIKAGKPSLA